MGNTTHSLLSKGQTCLVLSQREMQWKWKACWAMHASDHGGIGREKK